MKILITSGPTREYLDDVRYLSNASSGRMGFALATAAVNSGHQVCLVSGPVALTPPKGCELHPVVTTREMQQACEALFPECDGVIAAAAVCDYKPQNRIVGKFAKTGAPIAIEMIETDDVLAKMGSNKGHRWIVGFALETENARENALQKLRTKNCDIIVVNAPTAIGAKDNQVEVIDHSGQAICQWSGKKDEIAQTLIGWIEVNFRQP